MNVVYGLENRRMKRITMISEKGDKREQKWNTETGCRVSNWIEEIESVLSRKC